MAEGIPSFNIERSAKAVGGPMSKSPDRIDGLNGEKWAEWLVKDISELEGIESPDLKMDIRLLARDPDKVVTREVLVGSNERINQLIRDKKATLDETVLWQGRIAWRIEKLDEIEMSQGVGDTHIAQVLEHVTTRFEAALQLQGENLKKALDTAAIAQAKELTKLFGESDPDKEKERWVDVEYDQDFWARFQPNQEPKFYTRLNSTERHEWDARWQLARAAFYKRNTASMPDKAKENGDLIGLSQEVLETLYKHNGVREMLQGYAKELNNPRSAFWKCKDARDFEAFRIGLRERMLGSTKTLASKEADAIAWNMVYVFNLVESLDSRYSASGERHADLPSTVISDEYRTILHPQERAETKWASHHNTWGAFGEWGTAQIKAVEAAQGFGTRDEWIFAPATTPQQYWSSEWTRERSSKGGRKLKLFVPECYPVAQAGSFFEEISISGPGMREKSLLGFLLEGREVPWKHVKNDSAAQYVFGSFNKSVSIMEYFDPSGKPTYPPLEERVGTPWARDWAGPIKELFTRLKPGKTIDKLRTERKTYQTSHNYKVWIVYAAKKAQLDVNSKQPSLFIPKMDLSVLKSQLSNRQIGYLDSGESLDII